MHKTSAKQAGFHSANLANKDQPEEQPKEIMEAYQNLVMTTTLDKTTIAQLIQAIAQFVEANKSLIEQIAILQKTNNTHNNMDMPTNTYTARKVKID